MLSSINLDTFLLSLKSTKLIFLYELFHLIDFHSIIQLLLPRFVPSKHVHFHSIYNLFIKTIFMGHQKRNFSFHCRFRSGSPRRQIANGLKMLFCAMPGNYAIIDYLCTRQSEESLFVFIAIVTRAVPIEFQHINHEAGRDF